MIIDERLGAENETSVDDAQARSRARNLCGHCHVDLAGLPAGEANAHDVRLKIHGTCMPSSGAREEPPPLDDRVLREDDAPWPGEAPKLDGEIPLPVEIPDGVYTARCVRGAIRAIFNRRVLVLVFVITQGRYVTTRLPFFCTFYPKYVPHDSSYFKAWKVANGGRPPRSRYLPVQVFRGKTFRISTRSSVTDHQQQPRTSGPRSVVDVLLERLA